MNSEKHRDSENRKIPSDAFLREKGWLQPAFAGGGGDVSPSKGGGYGE
jgi:hypothetical protein